LSLLKKAIALAALLHCAGPQSAEHIFQSAASWVCLEPPAHLAQKVIRFEQALKFGAHNDPYAWKMITRYTLAANPKENLAGCSIVEWIPGSWSLNGKILAIASSTAGSTEAYDCPDGRPAGTVRKNSHFTTLQTAFRINRDEIWLENRPDAIPAQPALFKRQP
jgi:hypothetical protein